MILQNFLLNLPLIYTTINHLIDAHFEDSNRNFLLCMAINHYSDLFVDVRQRRGVRGSKYAFLNSTRLQERLGALGIRYLHLKELAPTAEIRAIQKAKDAEDGGGKRVRNGTVLSAVNGRRSWSPST